MSKVVVNPDKELVAEIRAKIKENNGHCACVVSFNEDNKCICKTFREQIDRGEAGECHCGLYFIVED
jgi:ferredoxin-thioredoxin reductase catalytic subunit